MHNVHFNSRNTCVQDMHVVHERYSPDYKWSSYRSYAYGKSHQNWLNTKVILSQFTNVKDQHQAYRENIKKDAKLKRGLDMKEEEV